MHCGITKALPVVIIIPKMEALKIAPPNVFEPNHCTPANFSDSRREMAGKKRQVLTTDNLMRRQEEPDRKRMRRTQWSGDSESGGEEATESSDISGEDGGEEKAKGEGEGGAWLEDDEDDVDSKDEALDTSAPDRFNFSRKASKPRTQLTASISSQTLPSTFLSLGVSPPLQASLSNMSIRTPTEVQAACIPPLLAGKFLSNYGGSLH